MNKQLALAGKVCLVTGASRGIGAAIAEALADNGATVALHYGSNRDAAETVRKSLAGAGHLLLPADFSDPAAAGELVEQTVERAGGIDVLVNNAGIYEEHPPLDTDHSEWLSAWRKTLDVNLLSPAVLCHAAAKVMPRGGRIINIGSRGAFRGEPDGPAYAASKAALHAMSQSLAIAFASAGIAVVAVAPGFVETDMARPLLDGDAGDGIRAQSPFGRVARPSEVAETVCFIASSGAEFLSGGIIDVNGASYLRS